MSTIKTISVPLTKNEYESLMFYVNVDDYTTHYTVKRNEALQIFSNFLSRREQELIEENTSINYVIFRPSDS